MMPPPKDPLITLSNALILLVIGVNLALSGCGTPVSVTKISEEEAYLAATRNPLSGDHMSDAATAVLHRFNLLEIYEKQPEVALKRLYQQALEDDRRDILFALAELDYLWAKSLPFQTSKGDVTPRAQDVYLEAAIYAYLYLLGPGTDPKPSPFDHRFREACELYNRSLDDAFRQDDSDQIILKNGQRTLRLGTLTLALKTDELHWPLAQFKTFHAAETYKVEGLTNRNRSPGLGAPLIGVTERSMNAPNGGTLPITAFLRVHGSLKTLAKTKNSLALELYSSYDDLDVLVDGYQIPLQADNTAPLAFRLNDPDLWKVGLKRFVFGDEVEKHVLFIQPYEPGRIPVVLVHGTGSSPVWWAEMVNTLRSDSILRHRYQFWFYQYTSSLPVPTSAADLRETLTSMIQQLDPKGKDPALDQMVVIGHSQGGLLAHMTAIDSGDRLWKSVSDNPYESLHVDPLLKTALKRALFFKPLPFVKRVVFISTPHRGSFLTKGWVRDLARGALALPLQLVQGGSEKYRELSSQLKLPGFLQGQAPTSVDGMSADSPVMKEVAALPLAPCIKAHSIIAVLPEKDILKGNDGVVEYSSAHIDGVESEYIVRTGHSAQGHPLTIEEVRRILLLHLSQQTPECTNMLSVR